MHYRQSERWVLMESKVRRDLWYLMMLSAVNSIYHWWQMNETWVWSTGGMNLIGENWCSQSECHPIATLSTINPKGLTPGHCGERLATNCLNHGIFVISNPLWEHVNETTFNLKLRSWLEVWETSSCYVAQQCKWLNRTLPTTALLVFLLHIVKKLTQF